MNKFIIALAFLAVSSTANAGWFWGDGYLWNDLTGDPIQEETTCPTAEEAKPCGNGMIPKRRNLEDVPVFEDTVAGYKWGSGGKKKDWGPLVAGYYCVGCNVPDQV